MTSMVLPPGLQWGSVGSVAERGAEQLTNRDRREPGLFPSRLEADEVMLRTDRAVVPTMMKGGTVSLGELAQHRRIEMHLESRQAETVPIEITLLECSLHRFDGRFSAVLLRNLLILRALAGGDLSDQSKVSPL